MVIPLVILLHFNQCYRLLRFEVEQIGFSKEKYQLKGDLCNGAMLS
jgi:hypothetical protein